eukprot:1156105-Pelagomonas_calceolata.AAC.1
MSWMNYVSLKNFFKELLVSLKEKRKTLSSEVWNCACACYNCKHLKEKLNLRFQAPRGADYTTRAKENIVDFMPNFATHPPNPLQCPNPDGRGGKGYIAVHREGLHACPRHPQEARKSTNCLQGHNGQGSMAARPALLCKPKKNMR